MDVLGVLMRWLHLLGAAVAVGGAIYAARVVAPAMEGLSTDAKGKLAAGFAQRLRPLAFAVIAVMLVTGVYNIMMHVAGKPVGYHIVLTLKLLLALHVLTMLFLLSIPPGANPARDARRPRLMAGAAISGLVVLLLSAVLTQGF